MIGAGVNTRVGPICRTVKDTARVLDAYAGYDPKDEMTAFSAGRMPPKPFAASLISSQEGSPPRLKIYRTLSVSLDLERPA